MSAIYIKTFGCKVNQTDSDALCAALQRQQLRALPFDAAAPVNADSVVIVNTCCVTAEAERKALQFVRKMRREHPAALLLLTGCSARNAASNSAYLEAGAVIAPWYTDAIDWLRERHATGGVAPEVCGPAAPESRQRTRAFIKVQDGCCNYCAYCIVPSVRRFASKPLAAVLAEARQYLAAGQRELVLTGVNIGHYGMLPVWPDGHSAPEPAQYGPIAGHPQLCDLLDAMLDLLPEGHRLRLSSVEPETVTPRLLELLAHPRMCPHLHMPLQSGSDAVLGAMRRRYTAGEYLALVARFRQACPAGSVTSDILVGYPTETEEDFARTLAVCQAAAFERVHGFPFSPRPGTAAAQLAPLPRPVVQQRNRALIAHCRHIADAAWVRFVGQRIEVLIEERQGPSTDSNAVWAGHGPSYQIVKTALPVDHPLAGRELAGSMITVRLDGYLAGEFNASAV
jgi:threonylcarbamoyladenosine tRNA methylthiotransferase MtaB